MCSLIHVSLDLSGTGSYCPSRRLLAEKNLPILVSLGVLGAGSRCLGEENKLTWYDIDITVAVACIGFLGLYFGE